MDKFRELELQLIEELAKAGRVERNGASYTYRTICYKGFIGDQATEYWTESHFKEHESRIAELKRTGEYGKPYIQQITLLHHPLYDEPMLAVHNCESYRITTMNFNNK